MVWRSKCGITVLMRADEASDAARRKMSIYDRLPRLTRDEAKGI